MCKNIIISQLESNHKSTNFTKQVICGIDIVTNLKWRAVVVVQRLCGKTLSQTRLRGSVASTPTTKQYPTCDAFCSQFGQKNCLTLQSARSVIHLLLCSSSRSVRSAYTMASSLAESSPSFCANNCRGFFGLHNHSDLDVDPRRFFTHVVFFFLGGVFCIVFVFVCFPPNDRHPVGSPSSLFYAACGTSNQVSCVSDSTE